MEPRYLGTTAKAHVAAKRKSGGSNSHGKVKQASSKTGATAKQLSLEVQQSSLIYPRRQPRHPSHPPPVHLWKKAFVGDRKEVKQSSPETSASSTRMPTQQLPRTDPPLCARTTHLMEIEPSHAYNAMLSWIATPARWLVAHPSGHTIFRNALTAADLTDLDLMLMFLDLDLMSILESSAHDLWATDNVIDSIEASDTIEHMRLHMNRYFSSTWARRPGPRAWHLVRAAFLRDDMEGASQFH